MLNRGVFGNRLSSEASTVLTARERQNPTSHYYKNHLSRWEKTLNRGVFGNRLTHKVTINDLFTEAVCFLPRLIKEIKNKNPLICPVSPSAGPPSQSTGRHPAPGALSPDSLLRMAAGSSPAPPSDPVPPHPSPHSCAARLDPLLRAAAALPPGSAVLYRHSSGEGRVREGLE